MANEKNLIPFNELSKNEHRKIAQKGGQKSGEVRRARRTLKEELLLLLENEEVQKRISLALIERASIMDAMGNKAFEVIRDTVGEKPIEVTENTVNVVDNKLDDLVKAINSGI
jgi:hypothetical protein